MSTTESLSLDAATRVQPIHVTIPEVKLPVSISSESQDGAVKSTHLLHPVTGQAFSHDELRANGMESLLRQYPDTESATKAREDSVRELRKLLDDNERKTKEIEREMEEKEKTRDIERKVYARKLGKDG